MKFLLHFLNIFQSFGSLMYQIVCYWEYCIKKWILFYYRFGYCCWCHCGRRMCHIYDSYFVYFNNKYVFISGSIIAIGGIVFVGVVCFISIIVVALISAIAVAYKIIQCIQNFLASNQLLCINTNVKKSAKTENSTE